jgi:hypothetical protein
MKSKNLKILLIILIIILATIVIYHFINRSYQFGDIIGTFEGVEVYSNQRGETNSSDKNYYNGLYTGHKWQCVEFVRRYLIIKHGVTFSEVDSAFEIPNAQFTTLNGQPIQMKNDLKIGSIIVWPKDYEKKFIYGHVAIVSSVTPSGIKVVEQNYTSDVFNRFIKINELHNVTILSLPE